MDIYKITNLINNKIYIGKANNYIERFDQHKDLAVRGSDKCPHLYNAMRKYGVNNFISEVIDHSDDHDELNSLEKFWINKLNSQNNEVGYNIAPGGDGGNTWGKDDELFIYCENIRKKRLKDNYIPITKELLEDLIINKKLPKMTIVNEYKIASKHFDNSCRLFNIKYSKEDAIRKQPEYSAIDYSELVKDKDMFKIDINNFSISNTELAKKYNFSCYILDNVCISLLGNKFFDYRDKYKSYIMDNLPKHGKNINPNDINDVKLLEYLLWYDISLTEISKYFSITTKTLRNRLIYLYGTDKVRSIRKDLYKKYSINPDLPDIITDDRKLIVVNRDNYLKNHFSSKGRSNGMYKEIDNWVDIENMFKDKFTLKEVSNIINISPPTLSCKIKERYGVKSIKEFRKYVK